MAAFNDGQCAKCRRRMGWVGNGVDKPACPSCGHKPDTKELESLRHDDEIMEEFAEQLRKKK